MIVTLAALVAIIAAIDGTRSWLASREIAEARTAAQAAVASFAPVTPDAAKDWLEANGYEVIWWNPHDPRGFTAASDHDGTRGHAVIGQRILRHGSGMRKWINLRFEFEPNSTFLRVDAEPWPTRVPTSRPML